MNISLHYCLNFWSRRLNTKVCFCSTRFYQSSTRFYQSPQTKTYTTHAHLLAEARNDRLAAHTDTKYKHLKTILWLKSNDANEKTRKVQRCDETNSKKPNVYLQLQTNLMKREETRIKACVYCMPSSLRNKYHSHTCETQPTPYRHPMPLN